MKTAHRHLLLAVIGGTFMVLGLATPANAHSELDKSNPRPNSQVKESPGSVALTFNENIAANGNGIVVTDSAGKRFDQGIAIVIGDTVKQRVKEITAPGRYTVRYRVVSADGHVVSSKYSFAFAPPTSPTPASTPIANTSKAGKSGLNGALVGAIVGGIAGGLTAFYLLRRNRSKSAT